MMKAIIAASFAAAILVGVANAESFEDMCVRVSGEWGTGGDVAGQCSCLAEQAADNSQLEAEIRALGEAHSSDAEAYEAGGEDVKAAFDHCSVDA
jgi:hypothetical protein